MKSKICGISDTKTLKYLTEHPNPPQYIGFIVNYPKSKRFVKHNELKELLKIDKKNSRYVAVLVQPDENILGNKRFIFWLLSNLWLYTNWNKLY